MLTSEYFQKNVKDEFFFNFKRKESEVISKASAVTPSYTFAKSTNY